jgi:predicted PurR-regulated permease PerM
MFAFVPYVGPILASVFAILMAAMQGHRSWWAIALSGG